ncbi:MAG: WD40 repeat domain-containing protein [Planctomycetaceae bacterium]
MLPEKYGHGWLVGDLQGSLHLWQPQNVRPFESLNGHHPRECWGLAWATDGESLFSVGDDHQLRAWDVSAFSEKRAVNAGTTLVSCVAVSPNGQYVATGGYDEQVRLFRVSDLELISQSAGHTHDIRTLAFSSDGHRLATAGRDRTIRLWNVPDLTPIKVLEGHTDTIRTLRWMANGNLVSSDSNEQILMWNSAGQIVAKKDEADGVHALEFAPAGVRFVSELSLPDNKTDSLVSTSPREELLVIGTRHGTIRFLHLPTNRVLSEIRSPDTEVRCLTFSHDGKTLVTGNGDGSVRFFRYRLNAKSYDLKTKRP